MYWFVLKDNDSKNPGSNLNEPLNSIEHSEKTKFKVFTTQEFSDLYNSFAYPNTQPIQNNFSITGNEQADSAIYSLAESLGYKVRSAPVTNDFISVDNGHLLQQKAAQDWTKLKAAAKKDGIDISVIEGYRSAEDQNEIFIDRLGGVNPEKIISHSSEAKLRKLLETTAPAGYSRHHTGYTVDLVCDSDPNKLFENSKCFDWISKNNYTNIKKLGWIPSYPTGIKNQGPKPESWEYVWVGLDAVRE